MEHLSENDILQLVEKRAFEEAEDKDSETIDITEKERKERRIFNFFF